MSESLPLPEDPLLATWASALNDAGYFANILDAGWRYVYDTDELLLSRSYMGVVRRRLGRTSSVRRLGSSLRRRLVVRGRHGTLVERGS